MPRPLLLLITLIVTKLAGAAKLQVGLYAESLCPYCSSFITQDVAPLFSNGLAQLMDFSYGAALQIRP